MYTQDELNAVVAAALEKAAQICESKYESGNPLTMHGAGERLAAIEIRDAILAIPRDSSALDEYNADIKRLVERLAVSTKRLDDEDVYPETVQLNKFALAELEAKYNAMEKDGK